MCAATHKAEIAAMGIEAKRRNYLTGEETARLLNGESPVRVWREKRGPGRAGLAEAAKIGTDRLESIENGGSPCPADLGDVLEVAAADLITT